MAMAVAMATAMATAIAYFCGAYMLYVASLCLLTLCAFVFCVPSPHSCHTSMLYFSEQ